MALERFQSPLVLSDSRITIFEMKLQRLLMFSIGWWIASMYFCINLSFKRNGKLAVHQCLLSELLFKHVYIYFISVEFLRF